MVIQFHIASVDSSTNLMKTCLFHHMALISLVSHPVLEAHTMQIHAYRNYLNVLPLGHMSDIVTFNFNTLNT